MNFVEDKHEISNEILSILKSYCISKYPEYSSLYGTLAEYYVSHGNFIPESICGTQIEKFCQY
jgi:hypothetical protein